RAAPGRACAVRYTSRRCAAARGPDRRTLRLGAGRHPRRPGSVAARSRSTDGRLALQAREDEADVDAKTLDLLTNPHTAYFLDRTGVLRRCSIWHRSPIVRTMSVER